jgi:DHA1 family multidrug resistance protein-like MFS transporter
MAALSAPAPLSEAQRRRGLVAIHIANFFAWGGFFLVVPLIAVHYVDDLAWAAGTIGLLLAVRQFTQQGATTLFGVLCDRIGPKPLICVGMVVRGFGFATMAYATSFWPLFGSLVLAAIGGAMFDSPKSAATAALTRPEERQRVYALMGVIGGIGVTIGTQLGAFLIRFDFRLVCLAAGSAYFIILFVVWLLLPPLRVSSGAAAGSLSGLAVALRDRTFVRFMLLMSGYWFAWTQFSLTITLAATEIAGTTAAVSWIYLVNTIVTVGLGFVLPAWLGRWLPPIQLTIWGMAVLSIGLGMVGFATSTVMVLAAAAVFSLGAVISRPGQETVTANLADPAFRGTYFGVAFLSMAIGGGLGNLVGGIAYDFGLRHDLQVVTWLMFGGVCAICALGVWWNRSAFSVVREEQAAEPPPPPRPEPASRIQPASATAGK